MDLILKLEVLTLKNNDLDLKDKTTKDILKMLFDKSELNIDYEKEFFKNRENNDERDDLGIFWENNAK